MRATRFERARLASVGIPQKGMLELLVLVSIIYEGIWTILPYSTALTTRPHSLVKEFPEVFNIE